MAKMDRARKLNSTWDQNGSNKSAKLDDWVSNWQKKTSCNILKTRNIWIGILIKIYRHSTLPQYRNQHTKTLSF